MATTSIGTGELPVISGVFDGMSWREQSGLERAILVNPSTEEPLCEVALAGVADLEAVVAPAASAFTTWSRSSISERIDLLNRIATAWDAHGEEIAQSVSREMGMPIGLSRLSNAQASARTFSYFAEVLEAERDTNPQIRDSRSFDGRTHVFSNAVGVVAAIAPWNFPGVLMTSKLAPAIAAGCTVVLKPAVENALTAHLIAGVLQEAGVPAGVVTIAIGGPAFGQELVKDPRIAMVAFTGSTAVGRAIGSVVGERLGRTNLELGGKSAAIVLDDADMTSVAANLPPLSFRNSGQTCFAQSRVITTPRVHDEVVEAMKAWAKAQILGPSDDDATTFGPLGTRQHRERVLGFRDRALAQGAQWVNEGDEHIIPTRGFFVPPVILSDVDNTSEVAQEEIFGPIVTIIRARDEDHAFELANDSRYGLAGSVWTTDGPRAIELARRVEAGSVGINGFRPDLGAPFGGIKDSGQGRENGPEALQCFLRSDSIYAFR